MSLKLSGSTVFMYPKSDHVPTTFTVLNFQVEDIDQAVNSLSEKGIMLDSFNQSEMKVDEKGVFRGKAECNGPNIAWFKDPAGNILSIVEGT